MRELHRRPSILAFVGSGGKTTLLKKMAAQFRSQGKTVLVTPTTHMFIETDTLLTDDPERIIRELQKNGYAMAGTFGGNKVNPLSKETFDAVCPHADVVLIEADGSRRKPLKYPKATEPVIPENVDEIFIVCGLNAIGQRAKDVCHRLELVKECLGIEDDTVITASHVQKLVTTGYLIPLKEKYPSANVILLPRDNGTPFQRTIAALLKDGVDVSKICGESFPESRTAFSPPSQNTFLE